MHFSFSDKKKKKINSIIGEKFSLSLKWHHLFMKGEIASVSSVREAASHIPCRMKFSQCKSCVCVMCILVQYCTKKEWKRIVVLHTEVRSLINKSSTSLQTKKSF